MSRTRDVDQLLGEARKAGLRVEAHGNKWRVTNAETGGQAFVPKQGAGRSLVNIRADLRRLVSAPPPMVAATQTDPQETAVAWPIEELIHQAGRQNVRCEVRGGLLHVSGPVDAEPLARLLRDRAPEVLAHLNPPIESEPDVPRIRDVARIDIPASVKDVAADARQLWQIIRGLAAEQGEEAHPNAGVRGVIWRGALARVVREAMPSWTDDHRKDVSVYLERTGHMKCQSRNGNPPVWWVLPEWSDGGLIVSKTPAKPAPRTASRAKPASPAVVLPEVGDPLAMLQAVAKRVSDAEARADEAELLAATLEEENDRLRSERDQYKAQVEQITNAFRVLAGGGS